VGTGEDGLNISKFPIKTTPISRARSWVRGPWGFSPNSQYYNPALPISSKIQIIHIHTEGRKDNMKLEYVISSSKRKTE
jgi:hypothetical protein